MVTDIYRAYEIYHQTPDHEQVIFNAPGTVLPRSVCLIRCLTDAVALPQIGNVLDFGCSNGMLLRNFGATFPDWRLAGLEISEKYREQVLAIPGDVTYFGDGRIEFDGKFDLIIMNHVLEHVVDPLTSLRVLRQHLTHNGVLLISVPNLDENPFDLLIADHCTHFRKSFLVTLLSQAGFKVVQAATDWLSKEVSIIASPAEADVTEPDANGLAVDSAEVSKSLAMLQERLAWLENERKTLSDLAHPFAVFGSSISACWCAAEFPDLVSYFLDEDLSRSNQMMMGKQIYSPDRAPERLPVYIALPEKIAKKVAERLSGQLGEVIIPKE